MAQRMLAKRLIKKVITPELITYLSIAVVGFSVNIGSRVIYSDYLGISFGYSVVLAYLTGMVVGFVLTKLFAFDAKDSNNTKREAIKFTMVSFAALLFTFIMSTAFRWILNLYFIANPEVHAIVADEVSKLGHKFINRELLAHLAGTGMGFFVNFFGHKFFTFRSTGYMEKVTNRFV